MSSQIDTTDDALAARKQITIKLNVDALPINTDMHSDETKATVLMAIFHQEMTLLKYSSGMPSFKHFEIVFAAGTKSYILTGPDEILLPVVDKSYRVFVSSGAFKATGAAHTAPTRVADQLGNDKRNLSTWGFFTAEPGTTDTHEEIRDKANVHLSFANAHIIRIHEKKGLAGMRTGKYTFVFDAMANQQIDFGQLHRVKMFTLESGKTIRTSLSQEILQNASLCKFCFRNTSCTCSYQQSNRGVRRPAPSNDEATLAAIKARYTHVTVEE